MSKNRKAPNNTRVLNALRQYQVEFDYELDLIYLQDIVKNQKQRKYIRG